MNVNIKFGAHGITLGHPMAAPGDYPSGVFIEQITDCPDDISRAQVLAQRNKVIVHPITARHVPWSAIAGKSQGSLINLA